MRIYMKKEIKLKKIFNKNRKLVIRRENFTCNKISKKE